METNCVSRLSYLSEKLSSFKKDNDIHDEEWYMLLSAEITSYQASIIAALTKK